ncbi:MAG: carbohydrate kinase family protein [Eubacteriales bacterium]|nr:carbohydrate kinase family protein [Eubacteriales bacterium]
MEKKVIVAGHICLDITPVFPQIRVDQVSDILIPGKLIQVGEADVHTGGAVANTGLAMKILGADVTLMGKIGGDAFGAMVQSVLKQYQARCRMIVSEQESTSYTVALAMPGIDRIFLHNPGANDTFTCEDMDFSEVEKADMFHFGYPPIMKKMYEDGGSELEKLYRKVKESDTVTSLDLAAVDEKSAAGGADWEAILRRVLPYVDFFVPSVEELCFMLDRPRYDEWTRRAAGGDMTEVIDTDDVAPLAQKILDMGVKVALIKCGAPGMYYKTAGSGKIGGLCKRLGLAVEEWADKEGFEESFVPERILSGTGAGDTSIAAFLTSVLRGTGLAEAVQMAAATGACCVAAYDSLSGLKPLEDLKKKIEGGWEKSKR